MARQEHDHNAAVGAPSLPFNVYAALGTIPGISTELKFGQNPVVGDSIEDIWSQGGILSYLSSAETMNVVSSSANDDSSGTGAQTIRIEGLDSNYSAITEDVTMNGTSNVETTNSYLRIQRAYVLTAGSGGENAGAITLTSSSAATVQAAIEATQNQTLKTQFTVPNGKKAISVSHSFSSPRNEDANIRLRTRESGGVFRTRLAIAVNAQLADVAFESPIVFPEHTDIKYDAIRIGNNNVELYCSYSLLLVDNDHII